MASIALENLTLGYDGHPAVHHLNGMLKEGSLTAVYGPNGSGKSTLLKALAGLLVPISGQIKLAGCDRQHVAYMPQIAEIDRSFPATVMDLVMAGLWQKRGLFGRHSPEDKARFNAALSAVGLQGFADRALDTLSGGQFQRALFARLILQDAQVILLDEPFAAVDAKTTADLLAIVKQWQSEGRMVVAVLHDEDMVRHHFPQTLLLAREPLGWGPTAQVFTTANLHKARHIHEAWDDAAPDCARDEHVHAH